VSWLAADLLDSFGNAIEFIFEPQESTFGGGREVGGLAEIGEFTATHVEVSALALLLALAVAPCRLARHADPQH
jgi:hypothetical protein